MTDKDQFEQSVERLRNDLLRRVEDEHPAVVFSAMFGALNLVIAAVAKAGSNPQALGAVEQSLRLVLGYATSVREKLEKEGKAA